MKYNGIIGVLLVSTALNLPTVATAGAGVRTSMVYSTAARRAASVSRAKSITNQSGHSASNAALYTSMGVSSGLLMASSIDEHKSKNPKNEIVRRIAIINIAKGSDDKVLMQEADIARNELAGYQKHRAQIKEEGGQKNFLRQLSRHRNPQEEITLRINIIKMVGKSDDAVLLKEAEIARRELKGYREYRENTAPSKSDERKSPKDEILSRISIIAMTKDMNDAVVKKEADIARNELAGYQEYRAVHKPKPIADSNNPESEIDWRLNIIKMSQEIDDPVLANEAEIAKSELAAYRNGAEVTEVNDQEQVQAQDFQEDSDQPSMFDMQLDLPSVDSERYIDIAKYGGIGLFILIISLFVRRKNSAKDRERDKYIKKEYHK